MKLKTINTFFCLQLSITISAQLSFQVEEIKFYNVGNSINYNVIIDDGCIGPGLMIEGYVMNTSDDTISIKTIDADFFLLYSYSGINYIEDLFIFSFDGLQDSLLFEPNSIHRISLEAKTVFMDSFYSPSQNDYYDEIKEIIPTLKILYCQLFSASDEYSKFKLFVSQDIPKDRIVLSCNK